MSDQLSRPEKHEYKSASKDIAAVLRGWSYEPGVINVRKIQGADGSAKLQMRLDLGLLQMEMEGRPDGARPHGFESLLDYHESQLAEHTRRHGTELGFQLNATQCASLRDEGAQYYHRYLRLFVLEEFTGVVRDTARNIRLLDLCAKFAEDEQDRLALEQCRPYLIMMHARAGATILFQSEKFPAALEKVEEGLAHIREFFEQFGQEESFEQANEVRMLKRFARDIRRKLPVNPITRLQRRLQRAVKQEHYEEAAKLRDRITQMQHALRAQSENPAQRA